MHICHEEILAFLSALPFLGLATAKLRKVWHKFRGFCIHEAWKGGEDRIVPGWTIERTNRDNWFFGFRSFFYDAPFYCFGFGFFQLYYYGYPVLFGRAYSFEKAAEFFGGVWVGPSRFWKAP